MTNLGPRTVVYKWDHTSPRWMVDGVIDETGPYLLVSNGELSTAYIEIHIARLVAKAMLEACDAADAEHARREAEEDGFFGSSQ